MTKIRRAEKKTYERTNHLMMMIVAWTFLNNFRQVFITKIIVIVKINRKLEKINENESKGEGEGEQEKYVGVKFLFPIA